MSFRRTVSAVAAVVALLFTSACSTLPTSGEPHTFALETPQREPLRQFGLAPQPGSTPAVLVQDFLRASAAGMYDDFATARLYLTEEASAFWRPDVQVAIFGSEFTPEPHIDEEGDKAVEVSLDLTTVGTVSEMGVLSVSDVPGSTSRDFTLVRDAQGEWRIAALDDGVVLSQPAFVSAYQMANLYFPSADLSGLIADPRWYPRTRLSSYLVKGLIDGPVAELQSAVAGNLAANLTLPTAGVDVVGGDATVTLEGLSSAREDDRAALVWQLEQTLRQAPDVQEVTIRLNGVQLDSDQVPVGPAYRLDRGVGLADEAVMVVPGGAQVADAETAGPDATYPTVGPVENSPVAWVNPGDNRLMIQGRPEGGARAVSIDHPSAPAVDRYGAVWVGSAVAGGSLWVVPPAGDPVAVDTAVEGVIRRVAVSPDGARIVLLVEGATGSEVWLGTIGRTFGTGGYAVNDAAQITQFSPRVVDVSWAGDTTVVALVGGEDDARTLAIHSIGGWPSTMVAPSKTNHVTAPGSVGSMVVQRANGEAFQRTGTAWVELDLDLTQISFPG